MARPVAGDFLRDSTPIFSPVARPVDTFVQGKSGGGTSSSEALAAALSGLDSAFSPILEKKEIKAKEREVAEGNVLFQKNRTDFGDAVKSGAIPAGASPYVRKGYRASQLHTLGANYATEMARGLEESGIYKVDDPAQIEEYIGKFYEQFTQTNNLEGFDKLELATVFGPMVTRAHDGFRGRQVERNIQFIETERFNAFEGEVLATLDMQTFDGSASQVGNAVTGTSEWLTAKAAELDAEGMDRTKISKSIIGIITSAAVEDGDLDILSVLDNVTLGTAPLSGTAFARDAMALAEDRILSAQLRRQAAGDRYAAKARAAAVEAASIAATQAALDGDDNAYATAYAQVAAMDASEARGLVLFKEGRDKGRTQLAQAGAWGGFNAALDAAETPEEARAVLADFTSNGLIPYSSANSNYQAWLGWNASDQTPAEQRFFTNAPARQIISDLSRSITGSDIHMKQESADRAAIMKTEYRWAAMDWYTKNRDEDGSFDPVAYQEFTLKWASQAREIYVNPEEVDVNKDVIDRASQTVEQAIAAEQAAHPNIAWSINPTTGVQSVIPAWVTD